MNQEDKKQKNPNVPNLRFVGFSDEWREALASSLFEIIPNNTISRDYLNYKEGIYKNIHYGDVLISFPTLLDATDDQIPYISTLSFSVKKTLKRGDVVIADTAEDYMAGKALEIVACQGVKVVPGLHTIACRPKIQFSTGFLGYYLNSPAYKDRLRQYIQGIKVFSISKNNFLRTTICYPSLIEQLKIGKLLSLVDQRIKVQNKIISQYESFVKGLYVWLEKRARKTKVKLGEIADYHSVGLLSKEELDENGARKCILYGELFTLYGEVIHEIQSRTNASGYLSEGREVLFPSSTTVDALSLVSPSALNEEGVVLGGDMFVLKLKPGFDNKYLSYHLNIVGKRTLARFAQGTTITHLYYDHIKNVDLDLPDYSTQAEIVLAMSKIERRLEIEKKLLLALERQKRSLLKEMFI